MMKASIGTQHHYHLGRPTLFLSQYLSKNEGEKSQLTIFQKKQGQTIYFPIFLRGFFDILQ